MNKNKFLCLIVLCMFAFINKIYAVEPKVIDNPTSNDGKFDFTIERNDVFDFSKIVFSTDTSGVVINGSTDFKKIYSNYTNTCSQGDTVCAASNPFYFTAYCLDGNKKYPEYEQLYLNLYSGTTEQKTLLFRYMTIYKVLKDCNDLGCTLFDNLDGVTGFVLKDPSTNLYSIDEPSAETLTNFDTGTTSVTSTLSKLEFVSKDGTVTTITAEDLSRSLGSAAYSEGKYSVTFKRNDFLINHYSVSTMPTELAYNKALWIIEHSYPTLDINKALEKAGVNYTELRNNIKTLENIVETSENADEIDALVKDYVYATTQYAIWSAVGDYYEMKTVGSSATKVNLGNSITNNTLLDKLYKYYLVDRTEYRNYGTTLLETGFNVSGPASGKEIYKTTSDSYIYGPFKISGKMIYTGSINVSVNTPTTGVTIIDKAGNILSSIADAGEIYVRVLKSQKATNIKLNLATNNAYVFKDVTKRGSLYKSDSKLDQLLATGGQLKLATVSGTTGILINPKTGLQDVGTIFLVALIAFTLGYVVLRFKQSPVKEI